MRLLLVEDNVPLADELIAGLSRHGYAVDWSADRLRFFIDGRLVKTVRQRIDYPVQLMLDVFEFAAADGIRDLDALPHVLRVEHVRAFAPCDDAVGVDAPT